MEILSEQTIDREELNELAQAKPTIERALGMAECLLFAAGDSVSITELAAITGCDAAELKCAIDADIAKREQEGFGLLIKRFEDRVQLCTRPEYSPEIFAMLGSRRPQEITRAMMEALAIVAYRQPITRAELEELRGVNSTYIINLLLERGFVTEAGKRAALGAPMEYITTEQFLRHFGIGSLEELPRLPDVDE